ncbi:2OG-Fe(II) oxygenase, partial [Arthrospira platensis SPKY1]|nr:2OG-Fe(II) oxygenase [Arthrospira platensis SPKY1]
RDWFQRVRLLSESLRNGLRIPINYFECHFAHYSSGAYYKKHLDAFRERQGRLISVICYLTPNWTEGDGGELLIYDHRIEPARNQPVIEVIKPTMGRLVLL